MTSDEEAVVGVRGRHTGDADAGLGEHVVHGQSHDVLQGLIWRHVRAILTALFKKFQLLERA